MTESGKISTQINNGIATIQFGHPAGNSFPSQLLADLTQTIQQIGKNPDAKIIILQSQGETTFCAGASFDELLAISDFEQGARFFSGFANVINAMRNCPKLIIGRIQGKAVGGGVGLAAACDYTFATEAASVKLSELAIGIGPFVIAPAVERKMGLTGLTELSLNATQWKSAIWAQQKGLYAEVFQNITLLDEALASITQKLALYNPEALTEMKTALWEGTEHWGTLLYERAAISGRLVLSDFTRQALTQFKK